MSKWKVNEEEFEKIFKETSDMIFSLGMRLFNHEEDALDFAQEAYLHAFRKLDRFEGKSKFSTWLYSVALNLGLNKIRKDKKIATVTTDTGILDEIASQSESYLDSRITEAFSRYETEKIVQEELRKLPDTYRIPLLLLYFEKMPYKKISEQLQIKEGTLKSNVHRGKLILRDRLMKRKIEL